MSFTLLFKMRALAFIALFLCCVVARAQNLNKPVLYQDGLTPNTPLTNVLPSRTFTLTNGGSVASCTASGGTEECKKRGSTYTVSTAVYSDNSASVPVCICPGAPFTAQGLASKLAQVPLHLRQSVLSIASIKADSNSAYTQGGHIVFFGPVNTDVFVHESSHAQDNGFSSSSGYQAAVQGDSCVPDPYANTNYVECYAQDNVVFLYKLWKKSTPPPGTACMSKQLNALQTRQAAGVQEYVLAVSKLPDCSYNCLFTANSGDTLQKISQNVGCKNVSPTTLLGKLLALNPLIAGPSTAVNAGVNVCFPKECCS